MIQMQCLSPGDFVVHPESASDLATLVEVDSSIAVVEWMGATGETLRRELPRPEVELAEPVLPREVYFRHDGTAESAWIVCMITHQHGSQDGGVFWKCEGAGINSLVPGQRIRFRIANQSVDVLSSATRLQFDTPRYFQNKSSFLAEYREQTNLCRGLTALLASSIDLYEHQIEVVERVLTDPIPKFILADEVGLGKTIEAGIILKQRELDGVRGKSLILVPDHLVAQWKSELQRRFLFGTEFGRDAAAVLSFPEFLEFKEKVEAENWSEIVVDEAHRVAAWGNSDIGSERAAYDSMKRMGKASEVFLLLSATPQETEGAQMLALLELLDGDEWKRSDHIAFQSRLKLREVVTDTLEMLSPENMVILDTYFQEIIETLDSGTPLHRKLSLALIGIEEEREFSLEEIQGIRVALNEGFRLHSRLIRSTRKDSTSLQVWRRWDEFRGAVDPDDAWASVLDRCESLANAWRIASLEASSSSNHAAVLYCALLTCIASGESAIQEWVALRRDQFSAHRAEWQALIGDDVIEASGKVSSLPREEDILDELEHLCREGAIQAGKTRAAANLALHHATKKNESLVFIASAPGLARQLFVEVEGMLDSDATVFCLDEDSHPEELMVAAETLRADAEPSVVFCSSRVEEGGNLQGAQVLVHADVPRIPGRLEQRIGRLDRIGQQGPVLQQLLIAPPEISASSRYLMAVESVFGTFASSISGVQVVESPALAQVEHSMLNSSDGAPKFDGKGLREDIRREKARMAREREMDAAGLGDSDTDAMHTLLCQHDENWERIRDRWSRSLCFILGLSLVRGKWRSGGTYRVPQHGTRAALGEQYRERLACAIGPEHEPSAGTFYRGHAVGKGFALRRVGDDLIDLVRDTVTESERGRFFGVRRKIRRECWDSLGVDWANKSAVLALRLDFELSANSSCEESVNGNLRRRVKYHFPTTGIGALVGIAGDGIDVVVDGESTGLSLAQQEFSAWADLDQEPYKDRRSYAIVADSGLHKGRHEDVISHFMDAESLPDEILIAEKRGRTAILESDVLRKLVESAQRSFEESGHIRRETMEMRRASLVDREAEQQAFAAGLLAIKEYQINLTSVGLFTFFRGQP